MKRPVSALFLLAVLCVGVVHSAGTENRLHRRLRLSVASLQSEEASAEASGNAEEAPSAMENTQENAETEHTEQTEQPSESAITGSSAIGPSTENSVSSVAPFPGTSESSAVAPTPSTSSKSASGGSSSASDDDGEGLNEGKVEDMITKVIQQIGRGQLVRLGNENNGKKNDIIVGNKNFMHKRDATDEDIANAAIVAALNAANPVNGQSTASSVAAGSGSKIGSSSSRRRHRKAVSSSMSMP